MRAIFFTILFFTSFFNYSQINTPRTSPASELSQMVGLTEIEVQYSRPSKRGRVIFGGVVPFGKIWRTGADNCTKINFSTDVIIDGKTISSGMYSIFSIPNKESWNVIFYSDTDLWGVPKNWDENKIVFQAKVDTNKIEKNNIIEVIDDQLSIPTCANDLTNFVWKKVILQKKK